MNYIKKVIICMFFLSLLSLTACGTEDKASISTEDESAMPETEIVNPTISDESATKDIDTINTAMVDENIEESVNEENIENPPEQSYPSGETEQSPELEENNYKSILLGKSNFICTDLANKSLNISEIGQAVTDDDSVTVSATKFAIIDIDGDGEDETVLWLQINGISDYGFEILHYQNGEIYGYTLPYSAFMNLKTDGTFLFSGGAADFGIGKIIFSETGYSVSGQAYSQSGYDSNNELTVQYFVNDESCSADEFDNAINSQEQKTDVKWYDLSDDNINAVF